ncbi:DctM14: C4-TRAP dicarboxylate transport system permease [Desulfosarcina variabilis str. Montpellier]|uniref:TRAP transporter large permease n=1 Tax=Desulfosarcina variabilis TaxID=2300 RepID=UPI003AFB38AC
MGTGIVTILLFASIIFFLALGIPLVFVLGGVAVVFTYFFLGPEMLYFSASTAFGIMDNFILISIPLFVFMGVVLQHSGIAEKLYEMIQKWIGGLPGGLAMGTVVICTIFAAMAGISAAATVTMGTIALPSMFKYNYHKDLAVGSISAGGALGILIPPSVLMIIYGLFADESIGKLFAGGVFPGLMLAVFFIVYIGIRAWINPALAPPVPKDERATWSEKISALKGVLLPIILVMVVLGSIFKGVATPTEAAAVGAMGSLVCALVNGSLNWKIIKMACYFTLSLSCMIIWIIIGGSCLTSVYTAIGAVDLIKELVTMLPVSRYVVLIGLQSSLFLLGMVLDPGGIIMICTPVFVPLVKSLGFDPVWFGVLFIVNMEMAYLTPPFGFNLFYMKTIVPTDVTMMDIYRSIIPFVLLQLLTLILLIFFPQIVMWLPNLLIK